jgi:hypothetical protein
MEDRNIGRQLDTEEVMVIIPECCREGWEDCPHVVRKDKERNRKNIGL